MLMVLQIGTWRKRLYLTAHTCILGTERVPQSQFEAYHQEKVVLMIWVVVGDVIVSCSLFLEWNMRDSF